MDRDALASPEQCSFTHNNAYWEGGAVYLVSRANATFIGCSFVANNASNEDSGGTTGGAAYISGDAEFLSTQSTSFIDNSASYGGALYIKDSPRVETNDGSVFYGNIADDDGGAIYIEALIWYYLDGKQNSGYVHMYNTKFDSNIAYQKGGAIFSVRPMNPDLNLDLGQDTVVINTKVR